MIIKNTHTQTTGVYHIKQNALRYMYTTHNGRYIYTKHQRGDVHMNATHDYDHSNNTTGDVYINTLTQLMMRTYKQTNTTRYVL